MEVALEPVMHTGFHVEAQFQCFLIFSTICGGVVCVKPWMLHPLE